MTQYPSDNSRAGMSILLVVIVLGVAALIIGLNAALLGLGALEQGVLQTQDGRVVGISDGCIEEGLEQVRRGQPSASTMLSVGSGTCILSVSEQSGVYTLVATSTIQSVQSVIAATAVTTSTGALVITSWEES